MTVYKKHRDAFERIFDGAYPKSRPAHEAAARKKEAQEMRAPDESAVQHHEAAPSSHDDCPRDWRLGYGSTKKMHPAFDSGPSGRRYDK